MNNNPHNDSDKSINSSPQAHNPTAAPSYTAWTQHVSYDDSASSGHMPNGPIGAHTPTDPAADTLLLLERIRNTPLESLMKDNDLKLHLTQAFMAADTPQEQNRFGHHVPTAAVVNGASAKQLSTREKQVLCCYAKGMKRMQVAEQMGLSFNTIASMRKNMLAKSRCSKIEELIQVARLESVI